MDGLTCIFKQKCTNKSEQVNSDTLVGSGRWESSNDEILMKTLMNATMNEEINEERYQFVLSLYLICTQYTQMGLFQPDFIWVTFGKMMASKYNRTDGDIKKAVYEWYDDPTEAEKFQKVNNLVNSQ